MNKVILMGRLTRDPEVRFPQGGQSTAIARYTLAVDRAFKREGEPTADFITIVVFGKRAEFASKYFTKGMMVCVVGELRIRSYDDRDGNRRWVTEVIASEQHFAEGRNSRAISPDDGQTVSNRGAQTIQQPQQSAQAFEPADPLEDDDLPF